MQHRNQLRHSKQWGVVVTQQILEQAPLIAIHYSKNIPLTDGSIPYHFINKVKEANVQLSLDINQTDYRDGHSYKWHANSYKVVFYDKIKDLELAKKSDKRTLEKDNALQLHLFDTLRQRKMFEVLRMEAHLTKRQKIKQLLQIIGITSDLTLKKLCKPAISKKVLLYYLSEIESKRPALLNYKPTSDQGLLAALILNNPQRSAKHIIQAFGLKKALEAVTSRELRTMFARCPSRTWQRLIADAHAIELPLSHNPFSFIRKHLMKFEPIKLRK